MRPWRSLNRYCTLECFWDWFLMLPSHNMCHDQSLISFSCCTYQWYWPSLNLLFRALPWWALWCEHNLLFITLGQLWPTVVVCFWLRKKALWPHLKPHLQPPWVVLQCLPTSFAKDAASSAWCQSYQRYASKCLPDTISWGYLGLHPTHAYLNEKSELVRWFDYSRQ